MGCLLLVEMEVVFTVQVPEAARISFSGPRTILFADRDQRLRKH